MEDRPYLLPMRDGSEWEPTPEQLADLRRAYPLLEPEFAKMRLWLEANPARRKLKPLRFVKNWLDRVSKKQPTGQEAAAYVAARLARERA